MKEKIKQIAKKVNDWKIFLLIIFIIGGAFYWYEWRPNQIKKECYRRAYKGGDGNLFDVLGKTQSQKELIYINCLKEVGLK